MESGFRSYSSCDVSDIRKIGGKEMVTLLALSCIQLRWSLVAVRASWRLKRHMHVLRVYGVRGAPCPPHDGPVLPAGNMVSRETS